MATTVTDTDPEAGRVQLELLRRATPERRLRLALSLTDSVVGLARGGIAARMSGASDEEIGLRFVELHYGPGLAHEVRGYLQARR